MSTRRTANGHVCDREALFFSNLYKPNSVAEIASAFVSVDVVSYFSPTVRASTCAKVNSESGSRDLRLRKLLARNFQDMYIQTEMQAMTR